MKILGNEKLREISIVLLIIASLLVIVLSVLIHYHSTFNLDIYLSRDLQSEGMSSSSFLYKYLYFISLFGRPAISVVLILMFSLLFWLYKYYREILYTFIAASSAGVNFLIKIIVNRPRPTESLVEVIDRQLSPSFPSGHVVFYTVFFGYLMVAMYFTKNIPKALRIIVMTILAILILSISFSRVYLGAHWASDVVGGYLVGFILFSILLHYYLKTKINKNI